MESNKEKILRVFFDNPTEKFHIRELARRTKLNPNTVLNLLKILIKEDLLQTQKKLNLVEVSVNRTKKFIFLKRVDNLKRIYESGLIDFLTENFSPQAISVIGSYSRGEDIKKSDLDLVVLSDSKNTFNLSRFEKFFSRKIHLLVINYKDMSDEFYINLINGLILYGYLNNQNGRL